MTALTDLTPADRHRAVAAGFTEHVSAVEDWLAPTPVDGWVARDVVGHLVGWLGDFLQAGGVTLPKGPSVGTDPLAAWRIHSDNVQDLLDGSAADSEFSHPMVGCHRLSDAIDRFYTADVFMHTWDLAATIGRKSGMDPQFAAHLLHGMTGIEDLLRSSGQYGPAVAVDADADPVTQLVAFIGRDPHWQRQVRGRR